MEANPLFKLTMRQGPRPDQTFELHKDVYTVGREAGNDIIINDPQVSRHHARLTLQGGAYVLEDLGSTNGTFVNGRRVTGLVSLSPGDMIGLGDTIVLAVSGGADAAATQVARAHPLPQTAPAMPPASAPAPRGAQATSAAPTGSRRMLVIGCAGLALLGIICVGATVIWSLADCDSFKSVFDPIVGIVGLSIICGP